MLVVGDQAPYEEAAVSLACVVKRFDSDTVGQAGEVNRAFFL